MTLTIRTSDLLTCDDSEQDSIRSKKEWMVEAKKEWMFEAKKEWMREPRETFRLAA